MFACVNASQGKIIKKSFLKEKKICYKMVYYTLLDYFKVRIYVNDFKKRLELLKSSQKIKNK